MIEKLRRIVESLGYPFFFGTRDEVYAYINSVRTVVACYRQGGGGRQQFFVFKFKGDRPQRMYEEVMREIKRQFTVGVQRVFFYDDVLEARFPLMAKNYTEGGARPTPPPPPPIVNDYMYFEAVEANSTVSLMSMLTTAPNLEYSTDGKTWQEWQHTTADDIHTFDTLTLTDIGDRVYLRGINEALAEPGVSDANPSCFSFSGKLSSGGCLLSLLDKTGTSTEIPDFAFPYLFFNMIGQNENTSLLNLPTLGNATYVGSMAMAGTCALCTALTAAFDMSNISSFEDDSSCGQLYVSTTLELISDGNLTFGFPTLPVTVGDSTLTTPQDVVDWMTQGL